MPFGHHSLYFVPSSALAVDLEYTSYTLDPPHVVASGLSEYRPFAPVGGIHDRITRDATEEFQFPAARIIRNSDALYQRVQVGRVTLAPRLDVNRSDQSVVDGFLVLVDRRPHLAQRPAQLRFALPLHRDLRQRHHGRGEDQQDGRDDKQLDEREAGLATQTAKRANCACGFRLQAEVPGCQGAKVPGCKGARVLECEGADARTGNGATPGQVIVSPLVLIRPSEIGILNHVTRPLQSGTPCDPALPPSA